ncbi:MAG: DUF5615 family PIN-like protein [Candidatus Korobacteraceae bacterium]
MKGLLLDQGLPRSTSDLLSQLGLKALHVSEIGLSKACDNEILDYAREHDLIVATLDADFHMLLAASAQASPSVIRLRQEGLNAQQAAAAIQSIIERASEPLQKGAVISATRTLMRIKLLPLRVPPKR